MVEVEADYVLTGPDGEVGLRELFEGRRQLIVGHFMFDPDWEDGCASCSAGADEISDGLIAHLDARDISFAYVSRAPIDKLERDKAKRGWSFPWYSSHGSDFNYDFGVTVDSAAAPPAYNYKSKSEHEAAGTGYYFDAEEPIEQPGTSCLLRDGERIFHTYSTYGRGAVVPPERWQLERERLLVREKELTRASDALAAERRRLPMCKVRHDYAFEGPEGRVDLLDLFAGGSQLIVYHFMLGPDAEVGCVGCSMFVDNLGHLAHLHA